MGTPLSEIYDAFFIKSGKDYSSKEDIVFQFLKTGISKSYKIVPHKLTYSVDEDYNGEFDELLDQDEIELIALNMLLEEKRQRKSELDYSKVYLGTKDFNKLPDKVSEHKALEESINNLEDEIFTFRQEFYSYSN